MASINLNVKINYKLFFIREIDAPIYIVEEMENPVGFMINIYLPGFIKLSEAMELVDEWKERLNEQNWDI